MASRSYPRDDEYITLRKTKTAALLSICAHLTRPKGRLPHGLALGCTSIWIGSKGGGSRPHSKRGVLRTACMTGQMRDSSDRISLGPGVV